MSLRKLCIAIISTLLLTAQIPTTAKILIDSDTIANIAEEASGAVVNIDTKTGPGPREKDIREKTFNFGGIELKIPDIPIDPLSGTGSGIVIRKNGYILTNNHVVKNADTITVTLKGDETKYPAELIAQDGYSDLAIIKINANDLQVAKFGDSSSLRPGDWVIAIGSPLGLEHTVTFGIISAISRKVGVSFGAAQGAFKYLQTDAAVNPGNSGGPLLNLNGEVIGVNTFIIGQNAQNLNFAIPSDYIKRISDQLIERGGIKHPYLGIKMTNLDADLLKAEGLPEDTQGIYVISVLPKSPAEISGLKHGDIIQKVDGNLISESPEVAKIIRTKKVGDKLNFRIIREGSIKIITLTVGELPKGGR